jgi:Kef-type K+ transport system membrane component KefB
LIISELFQKLPLFGQFAVIFGIITVVPKLTEKIYIPGVVGLIACGIVVGPEVLGLVHANGRVVELFTELGKLLLMFYAGHEIDLRKFRAVGVRAGVFGILTCAIPLVVGIFLGRQFGYSYLTSTLIGTLIASHTLLALPIIQRLGLSARNDVLVTIGATIFADITSMLLLALCVSVHTTGFSARHLVINILELAVYAPMVIFGLSALFGWIFRAFNPTPEIRFSLIIVMIAFAALAAKGIELEGIVGAFLTGIAVRRAFPEEDEETDALSVISHSLFIPTFFLSVGFLVNSKVFIRAITDDSLFMLALLIALAGSKFLAACIAGSIYGIPRQGRYLMWSLSLPQVAATLASALVAYNALDAGGQRLIDDRILNGAIVLVMTTAFFGPITTEYFGRAVRTASADEPLAGVTV